MTARQRFALALLMGLVVAPAAASAKTPACFGAASRNPEAPCVNPELAWTAVPAPSEAVAQPNGTCRHRLDPDYGLDLCVFGASDEAERATVALVGDSHASGMRPAVQAPATRRGWTVVSITHTSCPLSTAVRRLYDPVRFASCAEWKDRVFNWFAVHPEIRTVFVSGLSGGAGVVPDPGLTGYETAVEGYLGAWDLLPPTVRQIIVLRDSPKALPRTPACVERLLAAGGLPGLGCSVPRRRALDRDPMATAARRLNQHRVRVADLTQAYCDRMFCYPVVGGALVHRDETHVTPAFSATLGPFIMRALPR